MKAFENQKKIAAASKEIFNAFEYPTLLEKWWGPEGFSTTSSTFDFKPDGIWRFMMRGPDGKEYPNEMVFLEIAPPSKIVMRHTVEPYFTLTVTITDGEDGAVVNWHQDFDSEELAKNIAHIVKPANVQILDKLQSIVVNG